VKVYALWKTCTFRRNEQFLRIPGICYLVILDSFKCAAQDLTHHSLQGFTMWLRLEGDSDDPATWHPINRVRDHAFREDTSQPFVEAIFVSFHDETPELMLNDTDQVEFAILRPPQLPQT
jgi:hypothetical protein